MKKLTLTGVLLSGVLALAPLATPAQAESSCKMKCCQRFSVDEKLEKMTKKLSLTDEQKASIRTILEEKKSKMDGVKEQMKATMEETREKISALLNDEQKTKYEEMKKEKMGKMGKKKGSKKDKMK